MTPHSFTSGASLRLMHIPISSCFSKLQVSFAMKQRIWIQCPDLWTPAFFIPGDLGELFKSYLVAFPPILIKVISMFRCLGAISITAGTPCCDHGDRFPPRKATGEQHGPQVKINNPSVNTNVYLQLVMQTSSIYKHLQIWVPQKRPLTTAGGRETEMFSFSLRKLS